jgi:archaellum component FlaC
MMTLDKRYNAVRINILFLFIISLSLGCNGAKSQNPVKDLTHIKLSEDAILFTFNNIPRIYSGLASIDNEIVLIDNELERLKEIETQYPRQFKVVAIEKTNWIKIRRNLLDDLETLEKDIERLYVTYIVNKDKGNALIEEKSESIITAINTALDISTPDTRRLKPVEKKSFVARIKDKISS